MSKILPEFLMPPGLTLVLLLLAVIFRKRRPRLSVALFAFAWLSLWTFSTHAVSEALLSSLEKQYPAVSPEVAPQADAVIVLGGYLHVPGALHPTTEMNEGGDRLWMAAKLYRAQKASLVLLSGGNLPMFGSHALSEAEAAKGLLHEWGVPLEAMEVETQSRTTYENAQLSKAILAGKQAPRLLLVTSAFHMPRSMAIFHRAGLQPVAVPTDYLAGWDPRETWFEYLPDSENLFRSKMALHEWIGLLVYRLRGWA